MLPSTTRDDDCTTFDIRLTELEFLLEFTYYFWLFFVNSISICFNELYSSGVISEKSHIIKIEWIWESNVSFYLYLHQICLSLQKLLLWKTCLNHLNFNTDGWIIITTITMITMVVIVFFQISLVVYCLNVSKYI